jgi:O-antigen ligase
LSDAVRPPESAAPTLARRRRKPLNARTAEAAGWTDWIANAGFVALLVLSILGPSMTSENTGLQSQIRMGGYLLISFVALVALEPWRRPERLLVIPWPLLLALGWCWLSLGWAIEPSIGLRRLVLTSLVLWSTFALVRKLDLERSILLVRGVLVLTLVANFVVAVTNPAIGVHPINANGFESDLTGDWRGIMIQKNYAGLTCAMTILLFAFHAERIQIGLRLGVIVASAIFLYLSDSETSQIMVAVSLAIGALFAWLAQSKGRERLAPAGLAWVLLAIPAVLFVSMAIDNTPYLELLTDPAGFTGRTQIWTALIRFYADYPLFGAGYGSFWDLGPTGPIFQYAKGWVTEISQGHNGYLDLLVQIGLPGTLLVLFATMVWPTQRLLRGGDHPVRPLAAAAFVFCLGHNLTESMLFDRDSLSQVFLLIALAWLWIASASDVASGRGPRISLPLSQRR